MITSEDSIVATYATRGIDLLVRIILWMVVVVVPIIILTPLMMTCACGGHSPKHADLQNIRQLGMVLTAVASDEGGERFPITKDGRQIATSSTDVFTYLYSIRAFRTTDLVFAPGKGKVKADLAKIGHFRSENVGYNYMCAVEDGKVVGVSMADDDYVPIVWNSGNTPLVIQRSGASDLTLLDTGIWGKAVVNVYYNNNTVQIKSPRDKSGVVKNFIPPTFVANPNTMYQELRP